VTATTYSINTQSCAAILVTTLDLNGSPVVIDQPLVVTLSVSNHGSVYQDAGCTSALSSNQLTVTAGTSSKMVYLKDTTPESTVVTPSAAGITGQTGRVFTVSAVSCTNCRIFVTATQVSGSFGSSSNGPAAADAICAADANKPAGSTSYKALLTDASHRTACTNDLCNPLVAGDLTDWPLKASTTYYKADGTTVIGTTDSKGLLPSSLTNAIDSSYSTYAWAGIDYRAASMFSPASRWITAASNCNGWTDHTAGFGGQISDPTATSDYVNLGNPGCQNTYGLICVEQ
jgi:hypothetical protein